MDGISSLERQSKRKADENFVSFLAWWQSQQDQAKTEEAEFHNAVELEGKLYEQLFLSQVGESGWEKHSDLIDVNVCGEI